MYYIIYRENERERREREHNFDRLSHVENTSVN